MEQSTHRRHLIIQTAFLGDLLLGIPFFLHLRRLRPHDQVIVLCRRGLGQLMLKLDLADEVVEVDKSSKESWRLASQKLFSQDYDWLFCPHESFRSAWLVARLRARLKIGYRGLFNAFIFNHRIERPMNLPEALRQLALLEPVESGWRTRLQDEQKRQIRAGGQSSEEGELTTVPEWASMQINTFQAMRQTIASLKNDLDPQPNWQSLVSDRVGELLRSTNLRPPYKIVYLAPGSVWPTKMWTENGFCEVGQALVADGFQVVLLGSQDEQILCENMSKRIPGAVSFAGKTSLVESMELLALGDLIICNDSGSQHLAAAVGIPSVSIFGPTVLDLGYRPWQNLARVVQVPPHEMSCRPCGKHGARTCPLGTHACMTQIKAIHVLDTARQLIQTQTKPL